MPHSDCQFAAHRVFVILDGVYHVLQILSLFLLGKHVDSDVRCLVVDVTDVGDERDVHMPWFAVTTPLKGFPKKI